MGNGASKSSPSKPVLTLRVAVAGRRDIKDERLKQLTEALTSVYELITDKLAELSPGVPPYDQRPPVPDVAGYYRGTRVKPGETPDPCNYPVLRLVSGLADGADQIAFQTLLDFQQQQNQSNSPGKRTWYEYVSVLPCDPQTYQRNSSISDTAAFDKLLARSDYVLELDGICDPSNDNDPLVVRRRMRCFRLQSRVLLRQCDVLIAVPDLSKKGAAGGTRESIAAAIDMGIPVILISLKEDSSDEHISILNLKEDQDEDLGEPPPDWKERLSTTLERILVDPRPDPSILDKADESKRVALAQEEHELLDEYFAAGLPKRDYRQRLWRWFERQTAPAGPRTSPGPSDAALACIDAYRRRAADLSAAYASRYRGAFFVNYLFAACAVLLAVLSLLVFVAALHQMFSGVAAVIVLFGLGLAKLGLLITISLNTGRGNRDRWNDRAVDFRALSERLRTLNYLPLLGCLHPVQARSVPYAAAALRQNVVDWLFHAIVRQLPPDAGRPDRPENKDVCGPQPRVYWTPDVSLASRRISENWLQTQIAYHDRTSATSAGIDKQIEHRVDGFNLAVIVCVVFDLIILLAVILKIATKWECSPLDLVDKYTPILMAIAAFLPAVVASLNGFRSQSESQRLAERSKTMAKMLCRRQQEWEKFQQNLPAPGSAGDAGSWTLKAIDLAESCAHIVTDEVADWSILYSRRLPG